MHSTEEPRSGASWLIGWTPVAIALALIVSMMPQRQEWLYVAAVIGVLASLAVGRTAGVPVDRALQTRVRTFAKGWLVVVLCAALSVLHGKWQPMVFFLLVAIISTVFFWLGCKSSS
jgi:hypothetical protein